MYNANTGSIGVGACLSCVQGKYGPSAGLSACIPCAPGTYAGSAEKTSCDGCPPDKFTTASGTVSCQTCSPITTCDIATESTCIPDFGSKCMPCATIYACVYSTNKCFSSGTTPSCSCNPGFEMIGNVCTGCLPTKYKSYSGNGLCLPITSPTCTPGTFLQQGTAMANSACAPCPPLPSNALQGTAGCDWSCSAGFDNNAPV